MSRSCKTVSYDKGVSKRRLGKGKFVSCEGNKPMSVVWKMEKAMPVWVVSESSAIRI